ncbi:hypothetical protein GIB67_018699 [Kingdonia uniflora]|uniref:SWIM-type domain-containing protein n=1 Tax=Kingdonia uniflora TaxID=39325 RepID=A0A7J7L239_9MAGN|nr:hypothetical protein GIB67_018699 [Kingdonia uniflora]
MNRVQLYTIIHFGRDIARPKIGSIVTYVGGSTKLTLLRAYSSYEDFVTLLEETSKIRHEDCMLYNFVHGCACAISLVQDFTVMINMSKTNPGTPFHIWIVNELRVPSQNSQNFIYGFCSSGKGLSTTKDTGLGRGLFTTKAGGPLRHNSFPDPKPEYRGYPETNGRGLDPRRFRPFVDDENDSFETIHIDLPPTNESSIPQSNVYLSNKPVLTNVHPSNEPMLTNVPLSNEPSIPQSSSHLSNEPVLTNVPLSNEPMLTNVSLSIEPKPIIGQTETSAEFRFEPQPEQVKDLLDFWFKSTAYTKDPYDFSKEFNIDTESLTQIMSRVEITEEAEKSQARLTPWTTDHCESIKFVIDSLTYRVRTSRHHFQITSYGRTDSVNIEDDTCSCRWWRTMGITCEYGVRALGLANVDPTTRIPEY